MEICHFRTTYTKHCVTLEHSPMYNIINLLFENIKKKRKRISHTYWIDVSYFILCLQIYEVKNFVLMHTSKAQYFDNPVSEEIKYI